MTSRELRLRWVAYAHDRLGWSFTPLDGKKPRLLGWPALPRESREEALAWAAAGNVGVRTGAASCGLLVVDVDSGKGGAWESPVPTLAVRTGAGGRHHYFRLEGRGPVPNSSGLLAPHVDVRADGGQVVFVGGVHPVTGRTYTWAPGCAPGEAPLATAPPALLERCFRRPDPLPRPVPGPVTAPTRYASVALERERDRLATATAGQRGTALFAAAARLGELVATGLLDAGTVRSALYWACRVNRLVETDGEFSVWRELERGLAAGLAHPRRVTA